MECTNSTDDNTSQLKGLFDIGCRLSDVPLLHCSPDCVATPEKWDLASKSSFISLFLSSLAIPLSYFSFIPLPFVAPLNCRPGREMRHRDEFHFLMFLIFLPPRQSHIHPLWGVRVGQTAMGWPWGLRVFGGDESLAQKSSGFISS